MILPRDDHSPNRPEEDLSAFFTHIITASKNRPSSNERLQELVKAYCESCDKENLFTVAGLSEYIQLAHKMPSGINVTHQKAILEALQLSVPGKISPFSSFPSVIFSVRFLLLSSSPIFSQLLIGSLTINQCHSFCFHRQVILPSLSTFASFRLPSVPFTALHLASLPLVSLSHSLCYLSLQLLLTSSIDSSFVPFYGSSLCSFPFASGCLSLSSYLSLFLSLVPGIDRDSHRCGSGIMTAQVESGVRANRLVRNRTDAFRAPLWDSILA